MSGINYADLHKVYNQHLYNLPVAQEEPEPEPEPEVVVPQVVYVPAPPPPKKEPSLPPEEMIMMTAVRDPLRDMISTALPFALGYGVGHFLGMYGKGPNYVGNQHISDMSAERVAEYRRQGLLPPGG